MSKMEAELTTMHNMINSLNEKRTQLEDLVAKLAAEKKNESIVKDAKDLASAMKQWDEDMVQRKSKAYDDVENHPNKFTANYMFLMNHIESDIPKINQPSLDRLQELTTEWNVLKSRGHELLEKEIPTMNEKFWEAGVGAIWKK